MKEEKITAAELSSRRIKNMPVSSHYKEFTDIPIPAKKGILARKVSYKEQITTKGGIMLVDPDSTTKTETKLAVISAVGPECSEYPRLGLLVQLNQYVDSYFYHEGEIFYKCDEADIFYYMPSDRTAVDNGAKSSQRLRKEVKIKEQDEYFERQYKQDQNDKDKKHDKTKGKNRFLN